MKKLHLVALLGLFAAFCGMVFTSCGDDEADPDNPIVGTWSTSEKESNGDFSMTMTTSITFTSDGKYTLSEEGEHNSQDFTERFGSTICRDILGFDLSQPGELEKARESGNMSERCPGFVRGASEILQELMQDA